MGICDSSSFGQLPNGEEYWSTIRRLQIALEEGSYTIYLGFDSYGDGWNGAEMTILDPNVDASSSSP